MFSKISALCFFLLFSIIPIFAIDALNTAPLYRFADSNGDESYLAEPEKVIEFKKANPKAIQMKVGYVYLKKTADTVPLLGLTKTGEFGLQYYYTVSFDEAIKKQKEGWTAIQENKGIICYVRKIALSGKTISAWRFVQTNVKTPPRWRFGVAEYQQWKKLKSVKYDSQAGFYIWQNPIETNTEIQFDLRLFPQVYFIGENKPFNTFKYFVIQTNTLSLKKNQAKGCRTDRCTFYLGIQVVRNKKEGKLTVPIRIGNKAETKVIYAIFANGEKNQQIVIPVNLSIGTSVLNITLDHEGEFAEADETNNSISMNVKVE